jgi:hypothetical protein
MMTHEGNHFLTQAELESDMTAMPAAAERRALYSTR